jgi:hypothetical protein
LEENLNSKNTGGVGFLGLLTLLFIGLKLTGHIAWSWIWVLSPIWIPISIALLILSLVVLLVALGKIDFDKIIKYERKEK